MPGESTPPSTPPRPTPGPPHCDCLSAWGDDCHNSPMFVLLFRDTLAAVPGTRVCGQHIQEGPICSWVEGVLAGGATILVPWSWSRLETPVKVPRQDSAAPW